MLYSAPTVLSGLFAIFGVLYKNKTMLLFIGGPELIFVLFIVLLLFGSKKLPEVARMMGKGMREFRRATDEIKKEINDESKEITDDFKNLKNNLKG